MPDRVDPRFLIKFRQIIREHLRGRRFFIYVGGGRTARRYQQSLARAGVRDNYHIDEIGIEATRLNARLVAMVFGRLSEEEIITDPNKKITSRKNIIIGAGWKPGWSTDYDAVLLAKNIGARRIINLTNIDYVYDRNPKKFKEAKIIKEIGWGSYRNLVKKKWSPGLSTPFDPIAARQAEKARLEVIIINGGRLQRLRNVLAGRPFVGTIIR